MFEERMDIGTTTEDEEMSLANRHDHERAGANPPEGSLDHILTTIERREILGALNRTHGQRTQAARMLGISRSRLYRRMEALGIDPRKFASEEGE